jgi:outer membrane protein assembly factor BamC
MWIKALRPGLIVILLLSCSGCGFLFGDKGKFRDRSEDYKRAPELPLITVPQGEEMQTLREIYVIPQIDEKFVPQGEFVVPRPSPLIVGGAAEVVRVQKLGDQSWALIGVAPGQVWPQVRSFFGATGMQVARVDARSGIIESNWLTLENQPLSSRYRFRMEQGVQRGTSELHILQMNQGSREEDEWPSRSDNAELEAEMLQAVAQFLADSADSAPVSMIAEQGISAGGKISIDEAPEGYTYIRLALNFDRAWASLGRGLEKSSFEITDRDRSTGVYYARFLGPQGDEDDGWFDWMWSSDEEHPLAGQVFLVSMESENNQTVIIRLQPQDETTVLDKGTEQELLALIKGNIN